MSIKIRFIMLGRTRNAEIRSLLDDYFGRIKRYADLEATELRDGAESALRKIKLPPNAPAVLLDASGKQFSSEEFADWLGKLRDGGVRELIFLCGAAHGFSESLKRNARVKISLSPLTMSHELTRLVLAEQVYRAFTILAGHPYPK